MRSQRVGRADLVIPLERIDNVTVDDLYATVLALRMDICVMGKGRIWPVTKFVANRYLNSSVFSSIERMKKKETIFSPLWHALQQYCTPDVKVSLVRLLDLGFAALFNLCKAI